MPSKLARMVLSCVALNSLALGAAAEFGDYRALFVNRFEYSFNASSINTIFQNASDLGITDVMFQVRGRGDAFYDSNFEPRANNLSPAFDPLQTAIDAAHSRGIKIHAWMNTTPMWQANVGNPPAGHIAYNQDPSFRLQDINGALEPLTGWSNYSSVNPVLPEVHTHINNVVGDIASNYNVDGIHLDYIRYIPGPSFGTLPHDPISHQMFFDVTGLNGASSSNASAYRNFIETRITDLVASIKQTVDTVESTTGRTIDYSASVWRDPDVGEADYMQDYRTWLEQDLLDTVMPMIYLSSSNDQLFNPNLLNTLNIPTNTRVAPTLGVYLHTSGGGGVDLTISQLQRAYTMGAGGAALYGYGAMFNDSLSSARRQAIMDFYESIVPGPVGPGVVLDDFELNEGHFGWNYNYSPQTSGLAAGTTIERVTSEAHTGIASQELNLVASGAESWTLRHSSGIGTAAAPESNVAFPATGFVGFWLKTESPGVSVQIALDDPGTADRGLLQDVIADGQWHLYQWNLDSPSQWEAWVSGDGLITGPTVTMDSIFFYGDGDATIYLDNVAYNPEGPLAAPVLPGDFNGDGHVDGRDLLAWQRGESPEAGSATDLATWQAHYGGETAMATSVVVPEPVGMVLAAVALVAYAARRRR